MAIGEYLGTDTTDGVTIGKDSNAKVSCYGVTPVAQQAVGAAVATTDLTTTGILAGLNKINAIDSALKAFGAVKA